MIRDLVIVGSGPAGYTAAIYASRAQLNPVQYEGSVTAGGALMTTTEVENFPGFVDGVMGPVLMEDMRKQAARFGTELITDDVVEMDLKGDVKTIKDGSGNVVQARAVILATGSAYKHIGLANEDRLSGRGVSWCATCDGFFFRDQTIAVVGGGDSAVEEATFLTKFASKVVLIHRRDSLRASKIMADRALNNPKIEMLWNTEVVDILGDLSRSDSRTTSSRESNRRTIVCPGSQIQSFCVIDRNQSHHSVRRYNRLDLSSVCKDLPVISPR